MDFGDYIESKFPGVAFTGHSYIHRSKASTTHLEVDSDNVKEVMTLLIHGQYPEQLWGLLQDTFPGIEWILSDVEFRALCLLDVYRHLTGQGDSHSENKIKNPSTGNVFHRLGTLETIVTGIRWWHGGYGDSTAIHFRFRLAKIEDEKTSEEEVIKTRKKVEAAVETLEETLAPMQIAEPSEEQQMTAREKVRVGLSL